MKEKFENALNFYLQRMGEGWDYKPVVEMIIKEYGNKINLEPYKDRLKEFRINIADSD